MNSSISVLIVADTPELAQRIIAAWADFNDEHPNDTLAVPLWRRDREGGGE